MALSQPAMRGVRTTPLRRDPVLAFLPASWEAPKRLSPAWLAQRPLILNDAYTRPHRLA